MAMKKAVFFTIDALIAALIFMGGLLLLSKSYINEQPTVTMNYLAQDVLGVLGEIQVSEMNNTYIQDLIANGTITNTNNTLLEQIGEFWAENDIASAEAFVRNVTDGLVPLIYGFGMYINEQNIYKRTDKPDFNVVVARKIISGIEKNKPIKGYVSRAIAHKVVRNMTKIISFSPMGSGWDNNGYINISKKFDFTGNFSKHSAIFHISAHIGGGTNDINIKFNNDTSCFFNRNNITTEKLDSIFGSGYGLYGYIDLPLDCIINGMNEVTIQAHNSQYHGHLHPGSFLEIRYTDEEYVVTEITSTHSERYYFADAISYGDNDNGLFQVLPFFIPPEATGISVTAQIATKDVTDYTRSQCCEYGGWWSCVTRCRDIDYQVFLNTGNALDVETHPSRDHTYGYGSSQTASFLINGTNVFGVYLNSYGDYHWGDFPVQIYSDQENDPNNSSYIEVNYTYSPTVSGGTIEIVQTEQFGGNWETPKEGSFGFPDEAIAASDVFVHIVQIFSAYVRAKADTASPPGNQVFLSVGSRLVPTSIFIPSDTISVDPLTQNYIQVEDTYGSPRDFAPNTTIEYAYFVKSFVGYGNVFNTQQEANDDARSRLEAVVGPYVNLDDVEFENTTLTDVPSLWGPAIIEVRLWT